MMARPRPPLPQLPAEALPLAWLAVAAGAYAGVPALRRQVMLGYHALGVSLLADHINDAVALAAAWVLALVATRALARRGLGGAVLAAALLFGAALVSLQAWIGARGELLPERHLLLQVIVATLVVALVARFRTAARPAAERSTTRRAGWIAWVVLVLGLNAARAATAPVAAAPDVLLLVVHALRADHVGALGDDRGLTPHIDALAADGIVFEEALAASPDTAAAVGALLGAGGHRGPVPPATLAEVLRGHGYTTFGAAALPQVAAASQRPAGFETFDDAPMYADDAIDSALRVTGAVLSWLRTDRAAPVFVFAHYADPGLPWYYPDNGDDEPYAGPLVQAISRRALKLYGPAMDDADRRYVRGAYAAEVAYADRHLGRLLERLRDTGRYDDALIVVVGDHGMGLGEGAEERPGDLGGIARRHVHVPLVVKLPGGAHAGARAAGPLSLSDLAPALAAQLRVPWPAARTGARAPEPRVLAPEAAGLRRSRGAYRELRSEAQWMQGVRVGHLELMRDLFTGSRVLLQHGGEVPARTLDPDVDPGRTLRLERMLDRHFHSPSEPNAWAIGARPAPHPGGPP